MAPTNKGKKATPATAAQKRSNASALSATLAADKTGFGAKRTARQQGAVDRARRNDTNFARKQTVDSVRRSATPKKPR